MSQQMNDLNWQPVVWNGYTAQQGTGYLEQQFNDQPVPSTPLSAPILRSVHTPPSTQQGAGHLQQLRPTTPQQPRMLPSNHTPPSSQQLQRPSSSLLDYMTSPYISDTVKIAFLQRYKTEQLDQMYEHLTGRKSETPHTPDATPEKNNQFEVQQDDQFADEYVHLYEDEDDAAQQDLTSPSIKNGSPVYQSTTPLDSPPAYLQPVTTPLQAPASPLQVYATSLAPTTPHHQQSYLPAPEHLEPLPNPLAPQPIYAPYTGHFTTSTAAKQHRKRTRIDPKSHATDIARVRAHGRAYWVRRIYTSMIDISSIQDGPSSIHYKRFSTLPLAFNEADLEATAHHIFDSALAVHTRGWNRPTIYHKKVVRGKLTDLSEKSVEGRLARICDVLRQKKAVVDDAIRGGVTLALLCDNPEARGFTKMSNNAGNRRRGEKLRLAKELGISGAVQDGHEEGAEEE